MPRLAWIFGWRWSSRKGPARPIQAPKICGFASAKRHASGNQRLGAGSAFLGEEAWIAHGDPFAAERPRSLLLVVLLVLVVFILVIIVAVVVGVSHRAMGLMDLVVPQLAIGAVAGEQLGMGAALNRLAP